MTRCRQWELGDADEVRDQVDKNDHPLNVSHKLSGR
jgi:hypothetical protein